MSLTLHALPSEMLPLLLKRKVTGTEIIPYSGEIINLATQSLQLKLNSNNNDDVTDQLKELVNEIQAIKKHLGI